MGLPMDEAATVPLKRAPRHRTLPVHGNIQTATLGQSHGVEADGTDRLPHGSGKSRMNPLR
jgi:hypothetical protein